MRVVLDANILIAALLSAGGPPADNIRRWLAGEFELVVSEKLFSELERALAYPRLRRIPADAAAAFVSLLRITAVVAADPVAGLASADAEPALAAASNGVRAPARTT